MADESSKTTCDCVMNPAESCIRYHCQRCGRVLCENCVQANDSFGVVLSSDTNSTTEDGVVIKSCKFCFDISIRNKLGRKYCEKIHPSESSRQSPEPPSPSSSGEGFSERFNGCSPHAPGRCSVASFTSNPTSVSVPHSPSRSDEDDRDDPAKHFFSSYCNDMSDVDSSSVSTRHEFYIFKSVRSSPSDSPSRIHITSDRDGHFVQQEQGKISRSQKEGPFDLETLPILERPDTGTDYPDYNCEKADNFLIFQDQHEKLPKPLDFEKNSLVWLPPPPDDENDEREDNFFSYDDDDDYVGDSSVIFSSSNSLTSISMLTEKEKQNGDRKEPLRAAVHGHFRALVSQLLLGEGIKLDKENCQDDWLDVVTVISWQAAKFVKPDTSRGGSMDPGDYVKVKCIASGSPSESTFVKGIVCTKNIKHKRMTSQYRNPRLLVLGGALEYQRVPNQLASLDTLLQQEIDHLKMIVSKIEAHRPNVLLVEKTVSSYAQEYLLAKEISLVLNVKRTLLERIARCTGASITPSVDKLAATRLGHCELFRLERVSEELEAANQLNRKPSKTLMFFEGCPRRLGCTVLLKGSCREELKKVKHVVQYAVFAAYHLSLETSFLADEGASLPKLTVKPSISVLEGTTVDSTISVIPTSVALTSYPESADFPRFDKEFAGLNLERGERKPLTEPFNPQCAVEYSFGPSDALGDDLAATVALEEYKPNLVPTENKRSDQEEFLDTTDNIQRQPGELPDLKKFEEVFEIDASSEYYSVTDNHQSILVSFSSYCLLNGTVCERSRLLRIKFYGCFDKPLGRYLQDDLFDQMALCRSCKEPAEGHVVCYTHQQGNLTINVRRLPSVKLPGERDGKIWMWHRCLRCAHVGGIPPATRRVVMSAAAWGLSFGKFLELSFSNHATGNRVASCGHSLQRDCLRYYGLGSMVAFFRYSTIDILSVYLPPSVLEFIPHAQQEWLKKEVAELLNKSEALYEEILGVLQSIEQKSTSLEHEMSARNELQNHIMEFKEQLKKERNDYKHMLQPASKDTSELVQVAMDIFELNRLRHSLLISSHNWARRLCSLNYLLSSKSAQESVSYAELKDWRSVSSLKDSSFTRGHEENVSKFTNFQDSPQKDLQSEPDISLNDSGVPEFFKSTSRRNDDEVEIHSDVESAVYKTSLERAPSAASELSDKIDAVWSGSGHLPLNTQLLQSLTVDGPEGSSLGQMKNIDNPPLRRLSSPARVYSFDSAMRIQERIRKGLGPSSLHLSTVRSFHASGDYRNMVRDPISNVQRSSYILPREAQKFNDWRTTSLFISAASLLPKGARLLHSQNNLIIAVYDNDPTSIISYALSSKKYKNWIADEPNGFEGAWDDAQLKKENFVASTFSAWQSFGSLDLDYIHYGSYGSEDALTTIGTLFTDPKSSPHLRVSFEDKSSNAGGKVKFSVTCYFPKQFDALRKKCGCSEVDLVRSLSRCRRWSAQGGKSNVYFAKSLDERFIIKQVTKTELESFEEFAPEYFKYLTDSLDSGSPTCLAKVLGLFQVNVKHLKGGKETKMDMMVTENLFFRRNISRVYDLKGSARSRYNSDTTGANKVLLDTNLLEALRTEPMFLGSKAKRTMERAVWNDTSFLASVDVMDYSLLVGVDDERKELVLGIIDYMRQYTWDKHLETLVKASGILGGPKNASPTIVSPKQYKKRFRKAMTTYFLTVPHQWSS